MQTNVTTAMINKTSSPTTIPKMRLRFLAVLFELRKDGSVVVTFLDLRMEVMSCEKLGDGVAVDCTGLLELENGPVNGVDEVLAIRRQKQQKSDRNFIIPNI